MGFIRGSYNSSARDDAGSVFAALAGYAFTMLGLFPFLVEESHCNEIHTTMNALIRSFLCLPNVSNGFSFIFLKYGGQKLRCVV